MICDSDTANQILESHVFFSLSRVCLLPIPFLPSYTNTIPSIFCHLSRFGSPGSEAQTSITLALQLIWADNELFSSQPRHIICPASPGSVWVHPPSRTRPEYFTQEVGGGAPPRQMPEPRKLTPFAVAGGSTLSWAPQSIAKGEEAYFCHLYLQICRLGH